MASGPQLPSVLSGMINSSEWIRTPRRCCQVESILVRKDETYPLATAYNVRLLRNMALRWKLILALSTVVLLSGTVASVVLPINSQIATEIQFNARTANGEGKDL